MLVYSSCLFVFLFFLQVLLLIATLLVSLSFLSYCHVVILWSCFLSSFFSTLYCCHLSICHRFFLIWTFSFYFLFVSLPFFLLFFHLFYLSNLSIFIFILLFINQRIVSLRECVKMHLYLLFRCNCIDVCQARQVYWTRDDVVRRFFNNDSLLL